MLLLISSCKKDPVAGSSEFSDDPSFTPVTTDFHVSLTEPNELPCLFENNFLEVFVDSLPNSDRAWYIVQNDEKLYMSNQRKQVLTNEAKYLLEYKYIENSVLVDTTISFYVGFCAVDVMVSDAFSPDGNGEFEIWRPHARGVARYSCSIKNEKGVQLFTSSDFNLGWDGVHEGSKMPSGTYSYIIEGAFKNGKLFEYKGSFELIR